MEDDTVSEVVRCRHPGCDLFFNNLDEVNEHMKRNHSEEVKLACGMGGCDAVFDNRGALKRHRKMLLQLLFKKFDFLCLVSMDQVKCMEHEVPRFLITIFHLWSLGPIKDF